MNYKTIKYTCNCKYLFITDPDKRILKDCKLCPVHSKLRKHVVLWCEDCSLKMIEIDKLSWQRKRCLRCAKADQTKRTKANWIKRKIKYNTMRRKYKPKTKSEYSQIALNLAVKRWALKRLYRKMDIVLPAVETPMLDKFITKEV